MKRRRLLLAFLAWPALVRADASGLVAAAEAGDLAALRRLLDAGTPVDARDARGRTALLAATHANRAEAARLLTALARGAAPPGAADPVAAARVRELLGRRLEAAR